MKNFLLVIVSLGILIGFQACKKESDETKANLASLSTLEATSITSNSVTLNGNVISESNSAVTERGFFWSKNPNPDASDSIVISGFGTGEMHASVTGLEQSTTYYFKAFATNSIGTAVGEEMSFTTLILTPLLSINSINTSSNVAILDWQIENVGNQVFISKGVCYSVTEMPTIDSDIVLEANSGTSFLTPIHGLQTNTAYYVRVFVNTGSEVFYSDQSSFALEGESPIIQLKEGSGYTSTNTTLFADETFTIGAVAEGINGELIRFRLDNLHNNINTVIVDSSFNSANYDCDFSLSYTNQSIGENVLTFKVWDGNGNTASTSITITIQESTPVTKYTDITLGSFNDILGCFYSTSENLIYSISQTTGNPANQSKIDFVFFKGTVNMNSLASPDNPEVNSITEYGIINWAVQNQTRFQMIDLTVEEFNSIGSNYSFPEFSGYVSIANHLNQNDVIFFKTAEGKLGYVLVKDLFSRGDRITMDVIIEE